ncbi:hypothetical protein B0H63DRAFT_529118 [Podospora didyma]|uniref:NACHT domain-containing protein n=1 Tax=Podospora didyma TaxID=330526 RepID=A0AAE0K3C2_9PEZI|nr:hypothetical protein B0H63DRAFT_529118 [Podospora didyma]
MELLSALGLAANLFAVIDFSASFLSTLRQVGEAGSTVENGRLETIAKSLTASNDAVKQWPRPAPDTTNEAAFQDLVSECEKIADELLSTLHSMTLEGNKHLLNRFKTAAKTAWKKDYIAKTKSRLESMRDQLQFDIVVAMASKVDKMTLSATPQFLALDSHTQVIVNAIVDQSSNLETVVASQIDKIYDQNSASDGAAERRYEETISRIDKISAQIDLHPQPQESQDERDVVRRIISALYFDSQSDRFDDIEEAHKATFNWIYKTSPAPVARWPDFTNWLKNETGIYWINGKAGSGKSTLMKFLARDQRTAAALADWAGGLRFITLSFYFWNTGTTLQRSLEGLFRSILFQALSQEPELGRILFPERFDVHAHWTSEFQTFHQLRRAFLRFTSQTEVPLKVILIIDGLDEFEPGKTSMQDLAEIFISATQSPSFKALLSSRPLNDFEAAFADCPKLRLHDLTMGDITAYVNKIQQNSQMTELSAQDPEGARALVAEVVTAADGVFLWVRLVVISLQDGLRNNDTIPILKERLRELPTDLEDLFADAQKLTKAEVASQVDNLETRVKSYCAGLVEVRRDSEKALVSANRSLDDMCRIRYLHRSVADYVYQDAVWRKVLDGTSDADFNLYRAAMLSCVMKLKKIYLGKDQKEIWAIIQLLLDSA